MINKVGAVPFRLKSEEVEILFVTSMTRKRWVCPKGGVKKGENLLEACHREVFEEAGVKGDIHSNFPIKAMIESKIDGEDKVISHPVIFYPLEVSIVYTEWPEKNKRNRRWQKLNSYEDLIADSDFRYLLLLFTKLLPSLSLGQLS